VIAANPATYRIGALTANRGIPAGAIGVRCRKSGVAGWHPPAPMAALRPAATDKIPIAEPVIPRVRSIRLTWGFLVNWVVSG
jgi:hypothetical protein